jgi:hypothetical protein
MLMLSYEVGGVFVEVRIENSFWSLYIYRCNKIESL